MPLTFDFPLDQLKKYNGTNPCPPDFDEFWEEGLKEMRSTDSQVELIPTDFQVPGVECSHLYFTDVEVS